MKTVEKLYAYMGGKTEREIQLEAEREQYIREMEEQKNEVTKLVKSKGWQLVEKYLDNRIKACHVKMEKCGKRKLSKLQNEVKTIKGVFGFLNSKIAMNLDNEQR